MHAITAMAMRKFLARERLIKQRAERAERERQALLALELVRIDDWMDQQGWKSK